MACPRKVTKFREIPKSCEPFCERSASKPTQSNFSPLLSRFLFISWTSTLRSVVRMER